MRYLIDGHNLIAQLPDIDLADPDDEVKLVYKLRSFSARTGKRVTVVFDGGLPGGVSNTLSTSKVTVRFASYEQSTADEILLKILRKVKNAQGYILVSSDQELMRAARERGIISIAAQEFKSELGKTVPPSDDADEKDPNPRLSASEIDEWLAFFSGDDA